MLAKNIVYKKRNYSFPHESLFLCLSVFHWSDIVKKIVSKVGGLGKNKGGWPYRGVGLSVEEMSSSNIIHTVILL